MLKIFFEKMLQKNLTFSSVQRTIERDSNHPEANHVDWWIYDGKEDYVTINFSLAEEEE